METPAREMPPSRSAVMDTPTRRNAMSQKMVNLPVVWASFGEENPRSQQERTFKRESKRVCKALSHASL